MRLTNRQTEFSELLGRTSLLRKWLAGLRLGSTGGLGFQTLLSGRFRKQASLLSGKGAASCF